MYSQVFVGRFVPRKEREIELGEKAKKFTNVYIKNFNENLSEDDLTEMFSKYGKITSLKVSNETRLCAHYLFNCFSIFVQTHVSNGKQLPLENELELF